jgi:hypothetical protein
MDTWQSAYESRTDLDTYGDNAIGLFALALRFNIEDLDSVAADALTDGADDKKCDLVHVDRDEGAAVVAQCFMSKTSKVAAPANKASDLNTAVGWLLQSPIKNLPARLRPNAEELRDAVKTGAVSDLHIWYVHNLPESQNVRAELRVVESTANSAFRQHFAGNVVRVSALEVGTETLSQWYEDSLSPILVTEDFKVTIPGGFPLESAGWSAFVTALPAVFFHRIYKKYKTKLFSANVRDYLGSRKSDVNINHGIKQTAGESPDNFWVFNNGVTLLVNDFEVDVQPRRTALTIKGLSIVNGAQTTGAIGSLKKSPSPTALVPVRLIKTTDRDVVYNVIRYNNSQNKVTAPDFRSTDKVQKRLRDEFKKIPRAEYEGGRRGGHEDIIRRRANLLPSYTVGQALAAFHGDPLVAYNQKAEIWISDTLYSQYFNDGTTATHIVFAYSLLRAVEGRKLDLIKKSKGDPTSLTSVEEKQLEFFRNRGATQLFVSAAAACLETFLNSRISNLFRLSFGQQVAPGAAQDFWADIVHRTAPLCSHLADAFTYGLKSADRARKAIQTFQGLVEATAEANDRFYKDFASRIVTL